MFTIQNFLLGYGAVSLATMLFFWTFTVMGFCDSEIRKDADQKGISLPTALFMGLLLGVTWPKSMFSLFRFIHKGVK